MKRVYFVLIIILTFLTFKTIGQKLQKYHNPNDKIPKLIIGTEHIDRIFGQEKDTLKTILLNGKFCADLDFGWYCIHFQKKGKYKEISGHSYSKNATNGKWLVCNDTILLISKATRKTVSDTSYYIFKSDSLYSIYFNYQIKQYSRSKALIKQ